MGPFIVSEYLWRMAEIIFGFPCIFGGWVPLPCGQVLSSAREALVRDYGFDFVFFF